MESNKKLYASLRPAPPLFLARSHSNQPSKYIHDSADKSVNKSTHAGGFGFKCGVRSPV